MIFSPGDPNDQRAEEILLKGLVVAGLRDRESVLERLSVLYEESGQKAKKRKIDRQLKSMRSNQPEMTSSMFEAVGAGAGDPPWDLPVYNEPIPATDGKKKKIGRNQPCPCGSGKKYKYCCYA